MQKCENVHKALEYIRERGIQLYNIGAEDIVDGNLKLILGLLWMLILRFTITDIKYPPPPFLPLHTSPLTPRQRRRLNC